MDGLTKLEEVLFLDVLANKISHKDFKLEKINPIVDPSREGELLYLV